ncbi:MAG: EamA/RhaT family transporter [Pseudomonadota bacterium]
MSLWIPVTVAAALFQTLRFVLQKTLATSTLSAAGATFARFVYSAPLVALLLALYLGASDQGLPPLTLPFWAYGALGGFAQVLATVCVVLLFQARNFAVGITFKKTETILAVLVGLVLLGEGVSAFGFAAILLGVLGVLLLSAPPDAAWRWRDLGNRATGLGLASGLLFAISAVSYRAASLELAADDPVLRAGATLAAVTMMQMIGMAAWLRWREPGQVRAVWAARRVAVWVGLMSMGGSFCWFLAFTLQTAAYVKALGQVELIFSALVTVLLFRERVAPREWLGIGVLSVSIVALVLVI